MKKTRASGANASAFTVTAAMKCATSTCANRTEGITSMIQSPEQENEFADLPVLTEVVDADTWQSAQDTFTAHHSQNEIPTLNEIVDMPVLGIISSLSAAPNKIKLDTLKMELAKSFEPQAIEA